MFKCQDISHFVQQRCLTIFGSVPRLTRDVHMGISNVVLLRVTVCMQDNICSATPTHSEMGGGNTWQPKILRHCSVHSLALTDYEIYLME